MTQLNLILSATQSASEENLKKAVARELNLPFSDIVSVRILRRSVDARQRLIRVHLTVEVQLVGEQSEAPYSVPHYKDVSQSERQVVIVGAGPAGLFAALTLIENGIRPIVLERGKQVSERKKDIALLNRNQGLQAESNYCFGEGGAGTFSDGKLFSRSKKRGDMQRVMEIFHYHGAADSVLYETHAHIGSDHLPRIIENIRHTIITHGGQIHFSQKAAKIGRSKDDIYIITTTGEKFAGEAVILAIGHSAHDTYRMLLDEGISLEAKGFAMGVRVEHEQSLINRLMYHLEGNDEKSSQSIVSCLGNASYSLVSQVGGRGVYSFCMCPGGHIVPAASTLGSCVVNGMSASHRNSPFANSGMVVEIRPEDIPVITGQPALDALIYQESVERLAFEHGKEPNIAPAQRLQDFVEGRRSKTLPPCSYLPGLVASRLDEWLPEQIGKRLQQGFRDFNRKYPGFITNDAVVVGVESRSSSPVRIVRDRTTMQSPDMTGLYPAGEGAGYAGGITSSALDGIRAAQAVVQQG